MMELFVRFAICRYAARSVGVTLRDTGGDWEDVGIAGAKPEVTALLAMKSRCKRRLMTAWRKPRVEEDRRKCSATVFVVWRWLRRSGRDISFDVRSIVEGTLSGSSFKAEINQALRSRTQRIDPTKEVIISGYISFDQANCRASREMVD